MSLVSSKDFFDLGLKYCSRRETSREKLRQYFVRKIKEWNRNASDPKAESLQAEMQTALDQLESKKIIDDQRYAEILIREYQRRGKGHRYLELKLREKGLSDQMHLLPKDADSELEQACLWVEKWMDRGRFKKIEDPREKRQKLTQKLMTLGFDLTISKKAVALKLI
jgi:SOS response regulatory protein OraA/RecX